MNRSLREALERGDALTPAERRLLIDSAQDAFADRYADAFGMNEVPPDSPELTDDPLGDAEGLVREWEKQGINLAAAFDDRANSLLEEAVGHEANAEKIRELAHQFEQAAAEIRTFTSAGRNGRQAKAPDPAPEPPARIKPPASTRRR